MANKINKVSDETRERIKKKSALSLPNRIIGKPEVVKQAFSNLVTDSNNSALGEIDRVVDEINARFDYYNLGEVEAVKFDEQIESGVYSFIENSLSGTLLVRIIDGSLEQIKFYGDSIKLRKKQNNVWSEWETINLLDEKNQNLINKLDIAELKNSKIDKLSITNNLTTGGTDKVLSAEQGKRINEKLDLIITTPIDGVAASQELVASRNDIINGVNYNSLPSRLDALNSQVNNNKEIGISPKLSIQYAISKVNYRNTTTGDNQFTFSCFYQVYDNQFKTSGAVYAVEYAGGGMTNLKVFISYNGGDSWGIIGTIPCDNDAGEKIANIFVEPYEGRILILKIVNRFVTPYQYKVIVYDSLLTQISVLDIGTRYWHAATHNVDTTLGKDGKRIIMFAEYCSDDAQSARVWKSIDRGLTWSVVFEQTANNGVSGSGEVRHFHTLQVDPYTQDWYLGSGDNNSQCKIWRSQDDGVTWQLIFYGDQEARTLGFVFEKDYFYYGMDASQSVSKVFKVNKVTLVRTTVASILNKKPIYALTKTFFPKGFLIFTVHEWGYSNETDDLEIYFYDTEREKMYVVARLSTRGLVSADLNIGIVEASRCQCKFTGSIFLYMTNNLASKLYGMDATRYVSSNIMRAKLTM